MFKNSIVTLCPVARSKSGIAALRAAVAAGVEKTLISAALTATGIVRTPSKKA